MIVKFSLNVSGYCDGAIAGVSGPSTRAAIKKYRQDKALPFGETIDAALLNSLGFFEH